nr:pleiotropic drug resistance protein 1-like [Ipomoea batatas]
MKAREINARVNMLEVITLNMLEGFLNSIHILPNRKKSLPILHEVIGIIKPGRMTLLLGPSSSGKTALLLALAGTYQETNANSKDEIVEIRRRLYLVSKDAYSPALHDFQVKTRKVASFKRLRHMRLC